VRRAAALVCLLLLPLTAACGGDGGSTDSDEVVTVEITVEGDTVNPSGERIQVGVGQPVDLVVTADAPGVIGVHVDGPEQTYDYEAGTNEPIQLQFDRPGVVPVERHSPDLTIVSLQVQ
jgi:hypothetical protein